MNDDLRREQWEDVLSQAGWHAESNSTWNRALDALIDALEAELAAPTITYQEDKRGMEKAIGVARRLRK